MKTVQLRYVADVRTSSVDKLTVDGEIPVRLCNYVDVYRNDSVRPGPGLMTASATTDEVNRFRLAVGDTVLTKDSEDPADIGISAFIPETAADFVCGYHLAIARPLAGTHPRFLTWALRSRPVLAHFTNNASGISRYGLTSTGLLATPVPWPTPTEQRRIADFLDDRVARIDQIMDSRRLQIALLKEERAAVSEDLVWRGLQTPEASIRVIEPAKASPVRWGSVPNRYLLRESATLSVDGSEELLSVSHLTGVTARAEKNVTMFLAESLAGYKVVHPGELVINTLWAWMGALGVSEISGIVSPAYGVYQPLDTAAFYGPYYDALYRSSAYVCEMTRNSKGVWSSRLRLYPDTFLGLRSPHPAMAEQRRIYSEIEVRVGRNEGRAASIAKSVELLAEYKQSLITAAVTGGLDVAAASTRVPGE